MKHTILGAGGSIGIPLANELLKTGEPVRLVSRSGFSMEGAESAKADLKSFEEVRKSIDGSDIVYNCAGLAYNTKVWSAEWPLIMKNTIQACKETGARLIFFDNVYMYGKVDGKMTEATPYHPVSKKGEIRAGIARMLEEEMQNGFKAIIARAADLYGPYGTRSSMPYILALSKMLNGKKPQWMVSGEIPHSFSYTLDCAKAMVLLAKRSECFGQVWHMPTCNPPITGKAFIEIAAKEIGVDPSFGLLSKWMVRLAGLFDKTVAELYEMMYQNEFEYYFDSTKFNEFFGFAPTSYEEGIAETVRFAKQQ
jgi:nucleoside-diphosphate-sugar epimerase